MQPWMVRAHELEQQYKIPEGLYVALIRQESGGRQNVQSAAGAIGYSQLMPKTAEGMGINPHDPEQNLIGGAMYLSNALKRYNGNVNIALASYNAGPGAVAKYNGIPPYKETQGYIGKVNGYWKEARNGRPMGQVAQGAPSGQSAAPRPAGVAYDPAAALDISNQINRIQFAYHDAPNQAAPHIQKLQDKLGAMMTPEAPALGLTSNKGSVINSAQGGIEQAAGKVPPRKPGEEGWQYLQRVGSSLFGLKNDAGTTQTTGGQHSVGSDHYSGTAIDYGDGKNTKQQLNSWASYLNNNKQALGVKQVIWQAPDHYNHVHASTTRSSKPAIEPVADPFRMSKPPSVTPGKMKRRPVKKNRVPK